MSLEFCFNYWKRSKKIIESISWESLHCFDALISLIALGKTKKKGSLPLSVLRTREHEGITCREGRRGGQSSTRLHTQLSTRRRRRVAEPPSSCWLSCGSCGGGGKEQHLSLPRRFAFTRFLLIGKLSSFLSPSGKWLPKNEFAMTA